MILRSNVARHLLLVAAHHEQEEQRSKGKRRESRESHAPVNGKDDRHRQQGAKHIGGKLGHEVGDRVLEHVDVIDEAIAKDARRRVDDRAQGNARHLGRHLLAHAAQGLEGDPVRHHRAAPGKDKARDMGEGGRQGEKPGMPKREGIVDEAGGEQGHDQVRHHAADLAETGKGKRGQHEGAVGPHEVVQLREGTRPCATIHRRRCQPCATVRRRRRASTR